MPQEIVFPTKNRFELADYDDPPLGENDIRGPTVCTLVSQGTELAWANGDDFPIRPGYAAVFRVEEIGSAVDGIEVGELRFCMGAHRSTQQYEARFTLPVPQAMAPQTAVLARLMGVSMTTLMTTAARPGDKVIIAGAGPVGLLAAHNFKIGGYDVALVEPDSLRRNQASSTGITKTFEMMPDFDPAYAKKTALVVDCSGHEGAVLDACNIVRQGGEVVLVGVPWKKLTSISAHDVLQSVFFNYVRLRSGWEWELPILSRGFVWEELLEGYNNAPYGIFDGFSRALDWLSKKMVPVEPLVTTRTAENPHALYTELSSKLIDEPLVVINWNTG